LLALVGSFTACQDITEDDLSGTVVPVLVPPNQFYTTSNVVEVRWDGVADALYYDLQLGTPSFDSLVYFYLDTAVTGTEYDFVVTPGDYAWRIRARNGSSEGDWLERFFSIDSTSSLAGQQVQLHYPTDPTYTNNSTVAFGWGGLNGAERYDFRLYRPNEGSSSVHYEEVMDTSVTLTLNEGFHEWSVEARNDFSVTGEFSAAVHVDQTAPAQAVLNFPTDTSSTTDSVVAFLWTFPTDNSIDPSPTFDSLFLHSDSTTAAFGAYESTNGTLAVPLGTGTWFWRVRSYDVAGNEGSFSAWFQFTAF